MLRIPAQRPIDRHGYSAEEKHTDRALGGLGIANCPLASANAIEEIAGVAVTMIKPHLARPQRLAGDGGRVGVKQVAVNDDLARRTNEAGPALFPGFTRRRAAIDGHAT